MNKQIKEALSDFKFPEKLVVLVTGGRYFGRVDWRKPDYLDVARYNWIHRCLFDVAQLHGGRTSWLLETHVVYNDLVIGQGLAKGADTAAKEWADLHCLRENSRGWPADWDMYGRSAGSIRNQRMLFELQPHIVLAFPGGNGTADMVRKAKRGGFRVIELVYPTVTQTLGANGKPMGGGCS